MPVEREEEDAWLDRVLDDSFPASDPLSPHQVRPADRRPIGESEPAGDAWTTAARTGALQTIDWPHSANSRP